MSTHSSLTSQPRSTSLPSYFFQKVWLITLAAFAIVQFFLAKENNFIAFPFHHDDYDFLSYHFSTINWFPTIRPISTLAFEILSSIGQNFYYLTLQFLILSYVSAVLVFLSMFLELDTINFTLLFIISIFTVSFEHLCEAYKYTGLVTNLVSVTLGTITLICFTKAFRQTASIKMLATGTLFFVLTLLAKEDFILPVLGLCFYFAFFSEASTSKTRKEARLTLCGLILLAAALFIYNKFIASSPFTSSATSGTYKASINPLSLIKTVKVYLYSSRISKIALLSQLFSFVCGLTLWRNISWRKQVTLQAIIFSLILPYACLPQHIFPFYCLNWIPFQFGLLVIIQPQLKRLPKLNRRIVVAFLLVVAFMAVWISRVRRQEIINYYLTNAENNRNMVDTLALNTKFLQEHKTIGVVGMQFLCPWFGVGGAYLSTRYGLNNDWVVFVPKDGEYYSRLMEFQGSLQRGHVETRDVATIKSFHNPVIQFDEHGMGKVIESGERISTTAKD